MRKWCTTAVQGKGTDFSSCTEIVQEHNKEIVQNDTITTLRSSALVLMAYGNTNWLLDGSEKLCNTATKVWPMVHQKNDLSLH